MTDSSIFLTETLPMDTPDLQRVEGVQDSFETFIKLLDDAERFVWVTAFYWSLLPEPDHAFSAKDMVEKFGAQKGIDLYDAICRSVKRGVKWRIIESMPSPSSPNKESDALLSEYPNLVQRRQMDMRTWYGGGVMHQKIWIIDGKSAYVGSANMDWKSFSQVKEFGVVIMNNVCAVDDLMKYYEAWWEFSGMDADIKEVFDTKYQANRSVPAWSNLVDSSQRLKNPLENVSTVTEYGWQSPFCFTANGKSGDAFISASPSELAVGKRSNDEQGIVNTILDAQHTVCLSVMDFYPYNLFGIKGNESGIFWWPAFLDAFFSVCLTKKVHVKILLSRWAYTLVGALPAWSSFVSAYQNISNTPEKSVGKIEVKIIEIPGWNQTVDAPVSDQKNKNLSLYPSFTRVNHTKYLVTDRRANIGTSNMSWGYFNTVAGSSFNTSHADVISHAQKVFDRDWQSAYAFDLK